MDEAGHGLEGRNPSGLERGCRRGCAHTRDRNPPGTGYTATVEQEPVAEDEGVVASGTSLVEIAEVERILEQAAAGPLPPFSAAELAYAHDRSDPARRLAARLAAKRAAAAALGPGTEPADVEVYRDHYGPPSLRFHGRAVARLEAMGVGRTLVSLTHERTHAAAVVLLLREVL